MKYEAIVIGTSTGGLNALRKILPFLPANFSIPVIVVLHIGALSDGYWIKALNDISPLRVKEADEKEPIEKGTIYVAPSNYHLLVETDKTFSLSIDERVNYARPSIDVLFESAALAYKATLIGIILTGANSDGAAGMQTIKKYGGLAIAQNPETAESPVMPAAAIQAAPMDHIIPLEEIITLLKKLDHLNLLP